jgi:nicotinate-nucleotide adenylyltransferase
MELERIYPGSEFSLVLGTDALRNIQSWHRLDELIEKVEFLQLLRSGESVNEVELPAGIEVNLVQGAMLDISSTLIRKKVAKSEDVSELVDAKILDLVKGIYGA